MSLKAVLLSNWREATQACLAVAVIDGIAAIEYTLATPWLKVMHDQTGQQYLVDKSPDELREDLQVEFDAARDHERRERLPLDGLDQRTL